MNRRRTLGRVFFRYFAFVANILFLSECFLVFGQSVGSNAEQLEFFEREIRPVLIEHCYECHSGQSRSTKAGLLLDTRQGMLAGGDSGPAIVPANVDASLLIQSVKYEAFEMPPKGKLPQTAIDAMARWVAMGAPWPENDSRGADKPREVFDLQARKANHWAWKPIQNPVLPSVSNHTWPNEDLDYFILDGLEQAGLEPSTQADRKTLIRRLYFDLIGLPPTPDQLQKFVDSSRTNSLEEIVDELLSSPHFGERWGRHWLDLVRFAESRGHEFDDDAPNAYQYRDYIIRALNADVPYDQIVREHIAGDLLEKPRLHPTEGLNESIEGTGFWHLGEWVHSPVDIRKDEADRFNNMIDVMSKTFLGVTVSCARCHDHKFDAISTEDYYALSGFLQGSDYREVRFETMAKHQTIAEELDRIDSKYREQITRSLEAACPEQFQAIQNIATQSTKEDRIGSDSAMIDYSNISVDQPTGLLQNGAIFGSRARRIGEPSLTQLNGDPKLDFIRANAVANDPFWNVLLQAEIKKSNHVNTLAVLPRSGRTLISPTFELTKGYVDCYICGAGYIFANVDSHHLIAGPLHAETIVTIPKAEGYQWLRMNLHRYQGHRIHLEFTPSVGAQLEVQMVVAGATDEQLKEKSISVSDAAERLSNSIQSIEATIQANTELSKSISEIVIQWSQERATLQQSVQPTSQLAMAMQDVTSEDDHVLIRGNASMPGKIVSRRFLAAIDGTEPMKIPSGSGRLQLAERINAPSNPLTLRVIVNRIWHHMMGCGIVPTTDDFGALGQRPTHPELLDHLASRFRQDGQSIKKMIRSIALSKSYQMSSQSSPKALAADPKNHFWHYHPSRRLEGETIRDALLSVAGRLDSTMFGPSIPVHLTSFMDGRGRPPESGPLDGNGRRSIYQEVRRNFISPMMLAFDTPVPFSTMGRRNVSNVPAQSLILMNDPFVAELVEDWAKQTCERIPWCESNSPDSRIQWMYESAFGRKATEQELVTSRSFLNEHAILTEQSIQDVALWADFAHALVNKKEFIFLR